MDHAHPRHPITNQLIAGLVREGYEVTSCPLFGRPLALPSGCHVVIRLGEPSEGHKRSAIGVDLTVHIAGDIATGVTRRWRLTKTLRSGRGSPSLLIDALLSLNGDVSAIWIERDGATAYQMLCQLLLDARATLHNMPLVPVASAALLPTLVIDMKVLGDLATGRSGLSRCDGVSQCFTEIDRTAGLAACDRLLGELLPSLRDLWLKPRSQRHAPQSTEPVDVLMCAAEGEV